MARKHHSLPEMHTILMIDAVDSTSEIRMYGRNVIAPKIKALREFVEFFFVYKLKGAIIGKLGDGFLVLCRGAELPEVLEEAFSCMSFVRDHNMKLTRVQALNIRIAIHYGLVAPPDGGNYLDSNLHFAARLEGATPPNTICVSAVLHDIVADTLRQYSFAPMDAHFRGLGQTRFYSIQHASDVSTQAISEETQRSFYLPAIEALQGSEENIKN